MQFVPPQRLLMGPGPSNVHPRVYQAMSKPIIGHLDPQFLGLMNEIQEMLRKVFQTNNQLTIPMSGTGSSGMETLFVNLIYPGDKVIIGINGVFGNRMKDMAERCGATVIPVNATWGTAIDPAEIKLELDANPDAKAVAIVHAETSTGVLQPMEEIASIVKSHNALLIMDTVTSLGGSKVAIDEWSVDACFSGTQKCLSCPPGLSPVTLSDKALNLIQTRKGKSQSWYLDLSMVANYWTDGNRAYHHTAPINMNYALHESLLLILEEGIENRIKRHQDLSKLLWEGLSSLGLKPLVDDVVRLPQLNSVIIPEGFNEAAIRKMLLNDYGIEIGAGLGALAGKVWRIGLMGESCSKQSIAYLVSALKEVFKLNPATS